MEAHPAAGRSRNTRARWTGAQRVPGLSPVRISEETSYVDEQVLEQFVLIRRGGRGSKDRVKSGTLRPDGMLRVCSEITTGGLAVWH